jgi:hypothetical protein
LIGSHVRAAVAMRSSTACLLTLLPYQQHEIAGQNPIPDEYFFQAVDAIDKMIGEGIIIRKIVKIPE